MAAGQPPKSKLTAQGLVGLMGLFAGLCTIFALVVSIAEAWREHTQAGWPQVAARIQRCSVDQHQGFRRSAPRYTAYIECRISYVIGVEEIVTKVRSHSIPAPHPGYWQYPPAHLEPLQDWVDEHRRGSTIVVHYDPADHKNAVLIGTDMPYSGPRTPNNLKLLAIAAIACFVLLTMARMLRPSPLPGSNPPITAA
jgi:uncharacterized protein DUF3592